MAVSATGLAYALVVLLAILLIISILQVIQAVHAIRRSNAGQPTAPRVSLILLVTATAALTLGYAFDIMVVALTLVTGSEAPPPSQAYLVGVVITTFLAQGLAPTLIYASASRVIDERKEISGLQSKDTSSAKRRQLMRWTEVFLFFAFPLLITAYLGVFCKAVLDTPVVVSKFHAWLNVANGLYRAAIVAHAFLFQRLATRAISFHLFSKSHDVRDPIMHQPILYHLTPCMFVRTAALFVFTPLASSFATAKTPASATALLLAFTFFVGLSTAFGAQSLIGAARRPASQWAPPKTTGEQEVHNEEVPDADAPPAPGAPRRKHSRSNSIVLSPTRTNFSQGVHVQEETVTH
ncbi:hypothetical protein PIIN_08774 [Serendipita indica DSM 11827]|uniref:Uncharacterized protein n=1 Tax=Serendipita indica (strain DSM 11827) TaxID=1109443 RepID=G4TU12_SERID|nr:hypothetical protein PIIN_08774 [Serendipita indica DSM 11827]